MADLGTLQDTATSAPDYPSSNVFETSQPALENIASANDSTYFSEVTNSTHTDADHYVFVPFTNVPSDFSSILTISVRIRYFWASTPNGNITWDSLVAQIFKSDQSTTLTDKVTVASSITTSTPTNSSVIALTNPDTGATKTDWDGALLRIGFNTTRTKGGDTVERRISAMELTGTYTPTVTAIPNKIFQLNQAVKRSRYW